MEQYIFGKSNFAHTNWEIYQKNVSFSILIYELKFKCIYEYTIILHLYS